MTTTLADVDKSERVTVLKAEIAAAVAKMARPEAWAAFLDQTAKFHAYSFRNNVLIHIQHPTATLVAGFHDWKNKHGRSVNKGEKAIWILAPMIRKDDDGAERCIGFRSVGVFAADQTDGKPLATRPEVLGTDRTGDAPTGMVETLSAVAASLGYTVVHGPSRIGEKGSTNPQTKIIHLTETLSGAEQAETLGHEIAHVVAGHVKPEFAYHTSGGRCEAEIVAESVAHVISRTFGMEPSSATFGYIEHWAQGDVKKIEALGNTVTKAAKEVLALIEDHQVA